MSSASRSESDPHTSPKTCPLCKATTLSPIHRDKARVYWQCSRCQLIHVPAIYHLTNTQEKARYDEHKNHEADEGYLTFLNRLLTPMVARIPPGANGLDFGSGPNPVLAKRLRNDGFSVLTYDKFYDPVKSRLQNPVDFITCSEVVEHLSTPGDTLAQLWGLIRPGGHLGIMTKRVLDLDRFRSWHYIRDHTHICFFHQTTFEWLAHRWRASVCFPESDVAIFQKPNEF